MPTFATPEPISVRVTVGAGSVRLVAADRADTVVQVRPHDQTRESDVRAAEQLRVDLRDERKLTVAAAKRGMPRTGAVEIEIELPSQSRIHAELGSASLRAEGEFADVRISAAGGDAEIDTVTGRIKAASSSGSVTVRSVVGYASLATASGTLRVHDLDGDVKFSSASGSVSVDTLRGNLKARTASGSVIVEAAVRGSVSAHTGSGAVAVGVPDGTAVRMDIVAGSGAVTNHLQPADGPEPDDETLALHVRTGSGEVHLHRDPAGELTRQSAT
ncbi:MULTISPECIES: DUF4097 family beta strand repeat-containing protein [Mycobacterium]|uniref:DUF4097 domain-containing protein n=1 Tax=Mycobacterium kiyosense TaxID=2871094 RepID=A0A9P3UUU9_9MYCO|nr:MULTISPECIES: DUF4097 family beta strand repeat-containing protein [Mycobacterium]BDB43539.1 hypothetical protein IWGMT90018_39850 [Mycobacterium kiyosense]BDE13302.1 hypothetical protein MKCMC460_21620 [Mycobacterium sp. 20KCMC460]GLB83925.1 hypothetical protein SRL2020028_31810 [Mycobacterium kiyosense]GLB90874.1 hypothetical protein SRL2020130_36910 [Mycobacterium kiyosense]GLB96437.1 hypothetical protein SRL2020226_32130 [Mycobacterium kiyosense]